MASAFLVCRASRTSYLKLRCGRLGHFCPRPTGYQRKVAEKLNPRRGQTRPQQILKPKDQKKNMPEENGEGLVHGALGGRQEKMGEKISVSPVARHCSSISGKSFLVVNRGVAESLPRKIAVILQVRKAFWVHSWCTLACK